MMNKLHGRAFLCLNTAPRNPDAIPKMPTEQYLNINRHRGIYLYLITSRHGLDIIDTYISKGYCRVLSEAEFFGNPQDQRNEFLRMITMQNTEYELISRFKKAFRA